MILRAVNPRRSNPRRKNIDPATGVLVAAVFVIAIGGGVYYFTREKPKKAISGGGGSRGASCTVDWSKGQLEAPATQDALTAWAMSTFSPSYQQKPAQDAAIDLMNKIAPQCSWSKTTNATIHRPDGSTTTWAAVMQQLAGKTFMQSGKNEGFSVAIFGQEPQA